ncbi:MAG: Ig-like domain-containing protein, partial [Syntrophothermus sp.]
MMKFRNIIISLFVFASSLFAQQITGLSGWNIYLDPGHSQKENMGIYNYSEAEKNLRVAFYLRDMLLTQTDIDTVWLCRYDDNINVGLSQRSSEANNLGAAWFHSIHSNAGGASANDALLLYGQIRDYSGGPVREKVPNGGKALSEIMIDNLARGMRIPNRGAIGDLTFYGSPNLSPYLSVNRLGNMPTELSEAGYHTNPVQNTLNMNAEWKKLEATTLFWSILKYKNVKRPKVGILTGIIKDVESGVPVNGAKITAGTKTYTTDTYESLFKNYSSNPDELHNGFYYIENLQNDSVAFTVSAPGFESYSSKAFVVDTFFTFKDVSLVSSIPPYVASVTYSAPDSIYPGNDKITLAFSRPVNRQSFESGITLVPAAKLNFTWASDSKSVVLLTDSLLNSTSYKAVIAGTVKDNYNHYFDGNKDGVPGDEYSFAFKTKVKDYLPPSVVKYLPGDNAVNVDLMPVLNFQFNELVNEATLPGKAKLMKVSDQTSLNVLLRVYTVNGKTVANYYPTVQLLPNENYRFILTPGIEDQFRNATTADIAYTFKTGSVSYEAVKIDDFEAGVSNWWEPQQSGSTVGIISTSTNKAANNTILNP